MKNIIEQYGKSILAVGVGLFLFGMFGNISMFQQVGTLLWQPSSEIQTGTAFDQIKNQNSPQIFLGDIYALQAGKETEISEVLSAKSKHDMDLPVNIKKVYREDFEEVLSTTSGTICMQDAGIYWVLAEVKDIDGSKRSVMAKLFVNER